MLFFGGLTKGVRGTPVKSGASQRASSLFFGENRTVGETYNPTGATTNPFSH